MTKKFKGFKNRPFYERLAIPIDIFQKIRAYTQEADGEISGFGRTELVDEGLSMSGTVILVKEFEVFNQVCNPAHTTLKSEDMTQMYVGVARAGGDPSEWNFWWHSHVNFGTGFSGEDDSTMTKLTKAKNGQAGSKLTALCTNKYGDYDSVIYQDGRCMVKRLPLMILPNMTEEVLKDARKVISEKVTLENYKFSSYEREFGSNLDDNEFESDLSLDGEVIILNETQGVRHGVRLSKNQRRKQNRYNNNQKKFQRQPGWSPRP